MLKPNVPDVGNTASLLILVAASLSGVVILAERNLFCGMPSTVRGFSGQTDFSDRGSLVMNAISSTLHDLVSQNMICG